MTVLLLLACASIIHVPADGGFQTVTKYTVDKGPDSLCTGDIDGDGDQDIIVPCNGYFMETASSIAFLTNRGKGGFDVTIENQTCRPYELDLGDMDDDGDLDMVIFDNESLKIHYNDGDGIFTPGWEYDLNVFTYGGLEIADLNNDNVNDIFFSSSGKVYCWIGTGDNYTMIDQYLNMSSGFYLHDMNDDGFVDIVNTYSGMKLFGELMDEPNFEVYLNHGNGTFYRDYQTSPDQMIGSMGMAEQDDGSVILAFSDIDYPSIHLYEWDGSALSYLKNFTSYDEYDDIGQVSIFDIDSDNDLELMVLFSDLLDVEILFYDNFLNTDQELVSEEFSKKTTDFTWFQADADNKWDLVGWEGEELISAGTHVWVARQDWELPSESDHPRLIDDGIEGVSMSTAGYTYEIMKDCGVSWGSGNEIWKIVVTGVSGGQATVTVNDGAEETLQVDKAVRKTAFDDEYVDMTLMSVNSQNDTATIFFSWGIDYGGGGDGDSGLDMTMIMILLIIVVVVVLAVVMLFRKPKGKDGVELPEESGAASQGSEMETGTVPVKKDTGPGAERPTQPTEDNARPPQRAETQPLARKTGSQTKPAGHAPVTPRKTEPPKDQ